MDAIIEDGKGKYIITSDLCTDCGSCADVCPEEAIRGS
jgi:NAD-dependent dihydropyrimidine dehydrogenase PreA subunit